MSWNEEPLDIAPLGPELLLAISEKLDARSLTRLKASSRMWLPICNTILFKELFIDITATDHTYETMTANVPTWPFQHARRIVFFTRDIEKHRFTSSARKAEIEALMLDIFKRATKLEHIGIDLARPLLSYSYQTPLIELPSATKWNAKSVESRGHGHRVEIVGYPWASCDKLFIGDGLDSDEILAARHEGKGELTRLGCTVSDFEYHLEIPGEGSRDFGSMFSSKKELKKQGFLRRLPSMQNLRQLSIQISGRLVYQNVHGAETWDEYITNEMQDWYTAVASDSLLSHQGLEVVFTRSDSAFPCFFAAAKRVGGSIFLKRGVLGSDYSRYRYPIGLLDDENIFPDNPVVPEGHPLGSFVHLE
ncbi:hypothetical protein NLG97_g9740 [Lecanicillium saksenae]|uniref:Uncharacterized protein n=1 Tax=Lecanicillium saksenae TaxID=468837 RepID=A0ACC1QHW7_9HYPO|nr:hypothetical protein NLG97_g9740 [Lecanicillium saksenae]